MTDKGKGSEREKTGDIKEEKQKVHIIKNNLQKGCVFISHPRRLPAKHKMLHVFLLLLCSADQHGLFCFLFSFKNCIVIEF